MIYTITLNPSLDFITEIDKLQQGQVLLSKGDTMTAGGTAINISRVLRMLDMPTMATGFIGGQTGAFLEEELDKEDIPHDFVHLEGNTRISISLFIDGVETRILGKGPKVSMMEINELMFYLSRIREGDFVILAGSVPSSVPETIYARIVELVVVNGAQFLLGSIPAPLTYELLSSRPLLIAPTLEDLSTMFHRSISSKEDSIAAALECIEEGAQNVIINLRREGSILVTKEKKIYSASGPSESCISETYTNVSLLAGFIGTYMRTHDALSAFEQAQGISNATYYVKELPSREQMKKAIQKIEILPLS